MVATTESELPRLASLAERGRANGLAVREIGPAEMTEIEPAVRGLRALHIPESGVIDYRRVAAAYADPFGTAAARCGSGTACAGWPGPRDGWAGRDGRRAAARPAVVGCAGLQADRIAAMTGHGSGAYRIVPFRGDYYTFRPAAAGLVRGLVYPVPDPAFPFLGVHFTRGSTGRCTPGRTRCPRWPGRGTGGCR